MRRVIFGLLLLAVKANYSYSFPQGLFSQGLSSPRFFQVDRRSQAAPQLPLHIKLENPVKSLFNVFRKKTDPVETRLSKPEPTSAAIVINTSTYENQYSLKDNDLNLKTHGKVSEGKETVTNHAEDLVNLKEDDSKNVSDNEILNTETTTDYPSETTTDDYETTTLIDEPLNRFGGSNSAVVATLLG